VIRLPVTKCQATGNDFVLLSPPPGVELDYGALARRICHRRLGIGADGMLVIERQVPTQTDRVVRIFNADGSEAKACGNGMRCVALFVHESEASRPRELALHTTGGVVRTSLDVGGVGAVVRTAMGAPQMIIIGSGKASFDGVEYRPVSVLIGNEHIVAFVDVEPRSIDLEAFVRGVAPPSIFPDGINVEIVHATPEGLDMRVHERGVGETWACGTGACAASIAAIETDRARSPVGVSMRGGEVVVEWAGTGCPAYLTGGAEIVFATDVEIKAHEVRGAAAAR
jgi:diaminopimelate epimerase